MRHKFKKTQRLLKKTCYQKVLSAEKKRNGVYLRINFSFSPSFPIKLGITASSHFGNSVERNFFKRRIREIFRQNCHLINKPLDVVVYPHSSAKKASYQDLHNDFLNLVKDI